MRRIFLFPNIYSFLQSDQILTDLSIKLRHYPDVFREIFVIFQNFCNFEKTTLPPESVLNRMFLYWPLSTYQYLRPRLYIYILSLRVHPPVFFHDFQISKTVRPIELKFLSQIDHLKWWDTCSRKKFSKALFMVFYEKPWFSIVFTLPRTTPF